MVANMRSIWVVRDPSSVSRRLACACPSRWEALAVAGCFGGGERDVERVPIVCVQQGAVLLADSTPCEEVGDEGR